jgi:multidrug efflux pump subunit AcrB
MLVLFVVVAAATIEMYGVVPKGFIPDQDNDQMNINIRAAQGTSYYDMAAGGQRVADIVRKNENIDSFMLRTGGQSGYGSANQVQLQVNLVPRATRSASAQQISQQLRRQLLNIPNSMSS